MIRAELDKDPRDVAAMFDSIADRYDLLNRVLSLGRERYWRQATVAAVDAYSGELVLDLAAGTGTSSESFTRRGARVIACDFSFGMLRVGAERRRLPAADLLHRNAEDDVAEGDRVLLREGLGDEGA